MQVSWVLTEQERDRRYNKLKKVGFRNDFGRASNKTSSPTATPTSSIAMSMSQVKCIVALPTIPNVHFTVEERLHLEGIRTQLSNISLAGIGLVWIGLIKLFLSSRTVLSFVYHVQDLKLLSQHFFVFTDFPYSCQHAFSELLHGLHLHGWGR